ncbi:MAG: META domain-containing protein [Natronospirillum sp.]|uniref:META domain-containing protein n=1 Tax=Natronospirillum sp. TaxID=2812955 RepID=UPI0025D04E58|nr:META domain-containing protein [Natronospirillum sp.]MCH8552680.1 META domain-containing protein [Natronospirillum sp.]
MKPVLLIKGLATAACLLLMGCAQLSGADNSLYHDWRLIEVQGDEGNFELGDSDPRFTLRLDREGSASGHVACNQWRGVLEVESNALDISNASSTRARCRFEREGLQALEPRYLGQLQDQPVYVLRDNELYLTTDTGEQWRFVRR